MKLPTNVVNPSGFSKCGERVRENADIFVVTFEQELLRVLAHGILHLCGYKDKTPADSELMRTKEEEKMKLFSL